MVALLKDGKEKDSAYAICTKKLQDAGVLKPGTRERYAAEGQREFVLCETIVETAVLDDDTTDEPKTIWFGEQREPMILQTLIVSKEKAASADAALEIAKNFADGPMNAVDETEESFRFRIRDPGRFKDSSFRTIHPIEGIAMVMGKLQD